LSQHHGRAVAFSHFKDRQAGTKTQSRHGVDVGARLTAALHPSSRVGAVPMTRQPRTGSILPLLGPSLFAGHYRRESAGADKRRLPGFYKWTTCTSYLVNDSPQRRFRLAGTSLRFSCANVSYLGPGPDRQRCARRASIQNASRDSNCNVFCLAWGGSVPLLEAWGSALCQRGEIRGS